MLSKLLESVRASLPARYLAPFASLLPSLSRWVCTMLSIWFTKRLRSHTDRARAHLDAETTRLIALRGEIEREAKSARQSANRYAARGQTMNSTLERLNLSLSAAAEEVRHSINLLRNLSTAPLREGKRENGLTMERMPPTVPLPDRSEEP